MAYSPRLRRKLGQIPAFFAEFLARFVSPITDSPQFKAIYPIYVILVALFAALNAGFTRTLVISGASFTVVVGVSILFLSDNLSIRLINRWNIAFFNHYRAQLVQLSRRVGKSFLNYDSVDIVTFRSSDLLASLRAALPDFMQVTDRAEINIASFDIEYVPVLKSGIDLGQARIQLMPLVDFWTTDRVLSYQYRIPLNIRQPILAMLDPQRLYALPLSWGAVGVLTVEAGSQDSRSQGLDIAKYFSADENHISFDFGTFFTNISSILSAGYEIICLDWWTAITQLASLNVTGHILVGESDERLVRNTFQKLRQHVPAANMISDPVLIMQRVRSSRKCLVIGGGTWFGTSGRLWPIAIPDAKPAYGGFCECVGLLSAPSTAKSKEDWPEDAVRLFTWLGENIGSAARSAQRSSFRPYFFPALPPRRRTTQNYLKLGPTYVDEHVRIIFRQFEEGALDGDVPPHARRMMTLWQESQDSHE